MYDVATHAGSLINNADWLFKVPGSIQYSIALYASVLNELHMSFCQEPGQTCLTIYLCNTEDSHKFTYYTAKQVNKKATTSQF